MLIQRMIIAALACFTSAAAQAQTKLTISATASLASAPMFIAEDRGYFRNEGFSGADAGVDGAAGLPPLIDRRSSRNRSS